MVHAPEEDCGPEARQQGDADRRTEENVRVRNLPHPPTPPGAIRYSRTVGWPRKAFAKKKNRSSRAAAGVMKRMDPGFGGWSPPKIVKDPSSRSMATRTDRSTSETRPPS
jgi:hypothetical protein